MKKTKQNKTRTSVNLPIIHRRAFFQWWKLLSFVQSTFMYLKITSLTFTNTGISPQHFFFILSKPKNFFFGAVWLGCLNTYIIFTPSRNLNHTPRSFSITSYSTKHFSVKILLFLLTTLQHLFDPEWRGRSGERAAQSRPADGSTDTELPIADLPGAHTRRAANNRGQTTPPF